MISFMISVVPPPMESIRLYPVKPLDQIASHESVTAENLDNVISDIAAISASSCRVT
jgi:hypothetical protein